MDSTSKVPVSLEEPDIIVISSDEETSAPVNGVPVNSKPTTVSSKPGSPQIARHNESCHSVSVTNHVNVKKEKPLECERIKRVSANLHSRADVQSRPDSPQDTYAALEDFINLCRPRMKDDKEHHILDKLRVLVNSTDEKFLNTQWCKETILTASDRVSHDSSHIFVYIKDIFDVLKHHKKKNKSGSFHLNVQNGVTVDSNTTIVALTETNQVNDKNCSATESTEAAVHSEDKLLTSITSKNLQRTENKEDSCQQRNIKKLEHLLQKLHRKIQKIETMEMSLDDLERSDSIYLMEEAYKRRFMRVWKKLCEVRKQSSRTGRYFDKKFTFNGSRFPELNAKVEQLVNQEKQFPDFTDILKLVKDTSLEVPSLGLTSAHIEPIARDIFVDVGNELQQRRQKDVKESFQCILLNSEENTDPADVDMNLRQKLEEHHKEGNSKLQEIINRYALEQEVLNLKPELVPDDAEESSDGDSEEEEEEIIDNTSEEDAPVSDDEDEKLNLATKSSTEPSDHAQNSTPVKRTVQDVGIFTSSEESISASEESLPIMMNAKLFPEKEELITAVTKSRECSPTTSMLTVVDKIPAKSINTSSLTVSNEYFKSIDTSMYNTVPDSSKVPTTTCSPVDFSAYHSKRRSNDDVGSVKKVKQFFSPDSPAIHRNATTILKDNPEDEDEIILLD